MSSSLGSSSSYSSSMDSENCHRGSYDDLEDMIDIIRKVKVASSDDEKSDEDDDELVERGPVRPQLQNRSKPYHEGNHWQPPGDNSTDYDTSAKAILTDSEYRQKIDLCLNVLSSDMTAGSDSLSPAHAASGYSVRVLLIIFGPKLVLFGL